MFGHSLKTYELIVNWKTNKKYWSNGVEMLRNQSTLGFAVR